MTSIVGMGVFSHFWFWHPLSLFASLAFTPTAAIGLNAQLQMPLWRYKCAAPPSAFAYPPPTSNEKRGELKAAPVAVLSTSAKVGKAKAKEVKTEPTAAELAKIEEDKKAKEREREASRDAMLAALATLRKQGSVPKALYEEIADGSDGSDAMEADKKAAEKKADKADDKMEVDDKSDDKEEDKEETGAPKVQMETLVEKLSAAHAAGLVSPSCLAAVLRHRPKTEEAEAEAEFEIFENPSRMLRSQEKHFCLLPNSRYTPVLKGRHSGIIMLNDTTPTLTEELLPASAP